MKGVVAKHSHYFMTNMNLLFDVVTEYWICLLLQSFSSCFGFPESVSGHRSSVAVWRKKWNLVCVQTQGKSLVVVVNGGITPWTWSVCRATELLPTTDLYAVVLSEWRTDRVFSSQRGHREGVPAKPIRQHDLPSERANLSVGFQWLSNVFN